MAEKSIMAELDNEWESVGQYLEKLVNEGDPLEAELRERQKRRQQRENAGKALSAIAVESEYEARTAHAAWLKMRESYDTLQRDLRTLLSEFNT
ncbi:MAG: hypothetical protein N2Z22_00345, partial [Turneriella sp.]|nr:hypothetical protein [Turneriella sp.]